jgi:electron transport complex protein RnfA
MSYLSLAFGAILVNNVVLSQFLGICPFLGVSKKKSQAAGMGIAVIAVVFLSSLLTFSVQRFILVPLNVEYLQIATFILIIASLVQFSELIIKKFFPSLYKDFGIYLPLITTNCIVLGTALNNLILSNTIANFNFLHLIVYSLSIPVGYLIVIYLFSSIRVRLESAPIPKAFKGVPIALITTAFMALAFRGFSGIL